jgi:ABC-2 type transport system permease protein
VLAKLAGLLSALWLLLAAPQFAMFLGAVFAVNGWSEVWDELGDFAQGLANAAIHAAVVGALALLISSLLRRRAVAAPLVVAAFLVTLPVVGLLQALGSEAVQQIAGLFSPGTLVLGVRAWLFGEPELPDYGGFEPLYGAVALGLVAACVGLALLRYRRVSA